jgi:hypothetical protein
MLKAKNVWLMLGLIAISGNPVFSNRLVSPVVCCLLFLSVARQGLGFMTKSALVRLGLMAGMYALIFLAHYLVFGLITYVGSAFFLVRLAISALVVRSCQERFAESFFEAVFILCASSLAIYPLLLLTGPAEFPSLVPAGLLGEHLKSIGIFTVIDTEEDWWRNAGMMWEPGAFQGIINLALLLTPTEKLLRGKGRTKTFVLIAALLTTFSTTGYLVLFMIAVYKTLTYRVSLGVRAIVVLVVVVGAFLAITNASFLGQKIAEQLAKSAVDNEFSADRFGALLFDVHYIVKHPLIGNGMLDQTRWADDPQLQGEDLGHGNGLSNFVATFGFLGLLTYCTGVLTSGVAPSRVGRWFPLLIILTLSFGEQFLTFPLFLGLPFIVKPLRPKMRECLAVPRPSQPSRGEADQSWVLQKK